MENIDEVRSGWTFRIKETQALQMDDFENPGMIFVDKGIDLGIKSKVLKINLVLHVMVMRQNLKD